MATEQFPACPDQAFSPEDVELIVEVATDLYCYGWRTVRKMRAVMNQGLREGMFERFSGERPTYLPTPDEGFSFEFVKWIFDVARLRIARRVPDRPMEILEEDLEALRTMESSALQFVLRNSGTQGNASKYLSGISTWLQLLERKHRLLGLETQTLVVHDELANTTLGRALAQVMEKYPRTKEAAALYGSKRLEGEDGALALLNERDGKAEPYDDEQATEPDESEAESKPEDGGADEAMDKPAGAS